MARIGYARVSTEDQTLDLQRDALRQAGCIDIYQEHASGARATRPELAAALRACREGDVLVVWKLDRLGRSMKHLVEIVEDLQQRGIGFQVLTGIEVDTTTPHGKFAFQLSLSRLNHWLPRIQAHPEVVQGTTEFHHQIADALLPQADPVFHNAA